MSGGAAGPRVVIATDSAAPSGVGEHMLTLAAALRDTHAVCIAFPRNGSGPAFSRRAKAAGLETRCITGDETALTRWLRDFRPDLLHVHAGIGWEGHGLPHCGWMAGVSVVRTEHLPYLLTDERQQDEYALASGLVDHTIFVSDAARQTYAATGATGRRWTTIRNGIAAPQPRQSRTQMRAELGLQDDQLAVMTVARFTPQKGYGRLLAAAAEVMADRNDVTLLLVGEGPERAASERLADDLGIAASVRFLGERTDVADLMAAADLFVLASLFEGLPLVVLEAMASGLPVVATRIGGTAEALGSDYPWLVDGDDEAALADAVAVALADRSARQRLGSRNRQRFQAEFKAERMAAETAALYRAVLAERTVLA